MSPKSQLVPSTHITWLGNDISCKLLCNSYTRVSQVLLHLWLLRCLRFSFRSLARLLGHLQWLCAPASTCAPFLASAYALLHTTSRPIILPRNIWRALATACLTSLLPLSRRPIPPPTCMPLVYCDAALTPSGRYAASCFKQSSFATHVTAPAWVTNQQTAELYAVFHSSRQLLLRNLTHACLVVDNSSAYVTTLFGKCSPFHWARLRVLRRTNRVCVESQLQIQLALTPSLHNAADPFSRFSPTAPLLCAPLADTRSSVPNLSRVSASIPRFWWSCFYPSVFP